MNTNETLLVEHDDGVETWTLNLPEKRNPISDPLMVDAFRRELARVNDTTDVGAVVLTGAGAAFSAGGDLKAMQEGRGLFGEPGARQRLGYKRGIQLITREMVDSEVPVIAAVNGPAIGAGCDLATMCDIRIASTRAMFAESFVQLGLIPGDGGAWLLPRIVGHARAVELSLTGRRIDASTAMAWGLVSRVVAPELLLADARQVAREIADLPRDAVRMTKVLLRRAADLSLDETLDLSAAMQPLCHATTEHQDLVARFGRGK
jgi:enoyl-CoA hydratase/carnithine racemase